MAVTESPADLKAYVTRIRAEYLPDRRLAAREEGEHEARALLAAKAGAFANSDLEAFCRASDRDYFRPDGPSGGRWGAGLSKPQQNNWIARLSDTNESIARLWTCSEGDAYDVYAGLASARMPGGDMLRSLVLYLRNPDRFAVSIPSVRRGAAALRLAGVANAKVFEDYRQFNAAVQEWRARDGLNARELDVLLTHADPERKSGKADTPPSDDLSADLQAVLDGYTNARQTPFGRNAPMWQLFESLRAAFRQSDAVRRRPTLTVESSVGIGNWANVPWIALLDSRATRSTRSGVYCVYLFRYDMTGVYLTFNQGVDEPQRRLGRVEAKKQLRKTVVDARAVASSLTSHGFHLDDAIDLRSPAGLGSDYEVSTIAYKFYEAGSLPADAELFSDLDVLLGAYEQFLVKSPVAGSDPSSSLDLLDDLEKAISGQGFVFEPWQLAAYVTAVRTKPFVILAGVSGTGKSRLPALVSRATGGKAELIPVRPDWSDSSEVLGYVDLQGRFRPGRFLEVAAEAMRDVGVHHVCVLDEMNLARVEHYFAEVLSGIEDRTAATDGKGFQSAPLLKMTLASDDASWGRVLLPPNFAIVGTVNMDETTHGFSRKVIDRAFTLELSDLDLGKWLREEGAAAPIAPWPPTSWYPRATTLAGLGRLDDIEAARVTEVIETLIAVNRALTPAQLQVGYRTRDEIALFVLNAQPLRAHFISTSGADVDPLDLALLMKVLPRLVGGSSAIRACLIQLFHWVADPSVSEDQPERTLVEQWVAQGRPSAVATTRFPRTAARLCLMWERLQAEGFTSYWL